MIKFLVKSKTPVIGLYHNRLQFQIKLFLWKKHPSKNDNKIVSNVFLGMVDDGISFFPKNINKSFVVLKSTGLNSKIYLR